MTITHVIPYMHPDAGGPPVVVDRLCQRLAQRGWDVRVVTTDSMADGRDDCWRRRYAAHYPLEVHRVSRFRGYAYSRTLSAGLASAAKQSDLLQLHTLWTYPTLAAARICRSLGKPFLVMPHGMLDPHSLGRKRLRKRLYGRLLEWPNLRAARAIIYTHAEEQRLAESSVHGLPVGHIVPLGADDPPSSDRESLAAAFFREHPELRGRRLVLFLGRLHPKKGLDLLIPAFADVARSETNAHLLLIGPSNESYVRSLRDRVAQQGLAERVSFTGPLAGDAKWQALAASSVFVLPSYQENFALTVVEAMRVGTPVVLSRRVNIWQDVVGAGAGIACDLSAPSVTRSLLEYLANGDLRSNHGANGQLLVADRFTWDRSADAMEAVYKQILLTKVAANS
jgi:glycosyltransferase involved in cell wall biosynthesis